MARTFTPPDECPVCGAAVPRNARACPGCGADERSGWNEEATRYDGLDLPDAAYEDDSAHTPASRPRHTKLWLGVAILVLLAFVSALVLR